MSSVPHPVTGQKRRTASHDSRQSVALTTSALDDAFMRASPRISPRGTPLVSLLIHGGVLALWFALFARALFFHGVVAWSVGIAYVSYDTLLLIFLTFKTLPLLKPAVQQPQDARLPTLGIVVAAFNERAVLPVTLKELLEQDVAPAQIVIADDGSTDGTAILLTREYGLTEPALGELSAPSSRYPNLRWLRLPHGGKARALNAAITRLDTDTVLTVDADTRLAPNACTAMARAFASEPELVAATGVITPICATDVSGRFFQWFQTYEYIRNFISRNAWMRTEIEGAGHKGAGGLRVDLELIALLEVHDSLPCRRLRVSAGPSRVAVAVPLLGAIIPQTINGRLRVEITNIEPPVMRDSHFGIRRHLGYQIAPPQAVNLEPFVDGRKRMRRVVVHRKHEVDRHQLSRRDHFKLHVAQLAIRRRVRDLPSGQIFFHAFGALDFKRVERQQVAKQVDALGIRKHVSLHTDIARLAEPSADELAPA
jgi:glycosyltransferase involved in cell wall biosynthesis